MGTFNPRESVELLRRAFPAERDAKMGTCGWCGAPRSRRYALCSNCWGSLDQVDKNVYRELDIFGRARWILDNKPQTVGDDGSLNRA